MALFNKLGNILKKQSNLPQNYLSLAITSNKVCAVVWELIEDNIEIIGYSQKNFHSIDSLTTEAAAAIDNAAEKVKTDVVEVVYGLSAYWLEDGKLTKETSNILKKLSETLELDAKAFVPLSSSINHFLKIKETQNPSAVLIGALEDFTEIHLLSDNKVKNSKIYKGEATLEKIAQLLRQLKTDEGKNLPTNVVFFGVGRQSQLVEDFTKDNIDDIFEQKPKIQFITEEEMTQSVAFSQAADILGHDPQKLESTQPSEVVPIAGEQLSEKTTDPQSEAKEHQEQKKEENPDDFGFVEGADILKNQESKSNIAQTEEVPLAPEHFTKHSKHLKNEDYAVEVENISPTTNGYESPQQKIQAAEKMHHRSVLDSFMTLSYLSKFTSIFTSKGSFKKIIFLLLTIIIIGTFAAFALSQTITIARIIIKVNSKPQEDNFSVTVASGASIDSARSRIPGDEVTAQVEDSAQTNTTGIKKTGTNAKGEIKVLNWTTSKVTFAKSTVIISKNGVKFLIDDQVEVASRSASLPGEANTNATAQEFGSSNNLDSGVDFTFQKYDELLYSAKSSSSLAGGEEKQITVVSKDDQAKIEKSLLASLTDKAKSALREKLSGQELKDDAIDIKVTKKQFDKDIDQEASQVKIDMEVEAKALIYDQQILKTLLSQKTQDTQGANLEANAENIDILDLTVKKNKDSLLLTGKYRANLVPIISQDDLKAKIAGKNTKEARSIIKEIPEVSDIEVKFSPNLFLFSQLPKNTAKINFKIEALK
jgi:hypothetical protein